MIYIGANFVKFRDKILKDFTEFRWGVKQVWPRPVTGLVSPFCGFDIWM